MSRNEWVKSTFLNWNSTPSRWPIAWARSWSRPRNRPLRGSTNTIGASASWELTTILPAARMRSGSGRSSDGGRAGAPAGAPSPRSGAVATVGTSSTASGASRATGHAHQGTRPARRCAPRRGRLAGGTGAGGRLAGAAGGGTARRAGSPRAASTSASRSRPLSCSASASRRTEPLRGRRMPPSSRPRMVRTLSPERLASSSWVRSARCRSPRSSAARVAGPLPGGSSSLPGAIAPMFAYRCQPVRNASPSTST